MAGGRVRAGTLWELWEVVGPFWDEVIRLKRVNEEEYSRHRNPVCERAKRDLEIF